MISVILAELAVSDVVSKRVALCHFFTINFNLTHTHTHTPICMFRVKRQRRQSSFRPHCVARIRDTSSQLT